MESKSLTPKAISQSTRNPLVEFQAAVQESLALLAGLHLDDFSLTWTTGDNLFRVTVQLESLGN